MSRGLFLKLLAVLSMASSLSIGVPATAEQRAVRVTQAWIREAPPVSTMLAGYLTITNDTGQPVAVLGGTSPSFARVEVHRTEVTNGMARMRAMDRVVVPPGATVL